MRCCSASSEAASHWLRKGPIFSLAYQPATLPSPRMLVLPAGLSQSMPCQLPTAALQPPCPIGSFLSWRCKTTAKSSPAYSTFMPALRSDVDRDLAEWLLRQRIGGDQHHDLLAIVAGGLQIGLDLGVVARAAEHVEADVARHRGIRREIADRRDLERRIGAGDGRHERGLIDRAQQRAADRQDCRTAAADD